MFWDIQQAIFLWAKWRVQENFPGVEARGELYIIDFLGFTHYCGTSKTGKFRVKRVTSKKKMKSKLKKIKQWMKENLAKPVVELIKELNVKLNGHYNYFGITDNSPGIQKFAYAVRRALLRHLNRRRQGKPCDFLKFEKLMRKFPLAAPKIRVSIYTK